MDPIIQLYENSAYDRFKKRREITQQYTPNSSPIQDQTLPYIRSVMVWSSWQISERAEASILCKSTGLNFASRLPKPGEPLPGEKSFFDIYRSFVKDEVAKQMASSSKYPRAELFDVVHDTVNGFVSPPAPPYYKIGRAHV